MTAMNDLVGLQRSSDSQCDSLPDSSPGSQSTSGAQCPDAAGAPINPPANEQPKPTTSPLAGPTVPPAIENAEPGYFPPAGSNFLSAMSGTQPIPAPPAGPNPPSMVKAEPNQASEVGGAAQPAMDDATPNDLSLAGPILADPALGLFADVVDDLEGVRIANANRLRQLTDQGENGHGLTAEHPEVRRLAAMVEQLEDLEHQAVLNLKRAMRNHPLGAWVKATKGVGEKQAARLLASIRDPYWNDLHGRPRRVYELYSYCGMSTVEASHPGSQITPGTQAVAAARVAPSRKRGERANWNGAARQRVWLIAESCVKVRTSPYRDVYDATRLKYADAVHQVPCVRCGPSGSPAEPGSPLSAGHQHARAMRAMCKQILLDLWREARNLHHTTDTEGC